MVSLDTHVLVFALEGKLTAAERRLLTTETWSISAIVLWELTKLEQRGRIEVDLEDREVIRALSQVHVWPLSLEICLAIRTLDFSGDPADEIIAATSLVHKVPLMTRDGRIRKSKVVPLAA